MKRIMSICCLILAGAAVASAQTSIEWDRTFGGTANDGFRSIIATDDGGILAVGLTYSFSANADIYLAKLDAQGDSTWTKTIGGAGRDYGWGICQTNDGGYVITGYTTLAGSGGMDLYLIKIDTGGNVLWSKTYGGEGDEEGRAVCETGDGHLIISGWTESFGAGQKDLYFLKADSAGDTLWTKTFGGEGLDWGTAVCETSDGAYGVGGTIGTTASNNLDLYLLKIHADGTLLWEKNLASSGEIDADFGTGIWPTENGGIVITGYGNDHTLNDAEDIWLIHVDGDGNELWSHRYGEPGNYYDYGCAVSRTSDDGFLICGVTKEPITQKNDLYLVKTDADGNKLWSQVIENSGSQWGSSIAALTGDTFAIAGHTEASGAGRFDGWILKLYAPAAGLDEPENDGHGAFIKMSPNPSRAETNIRFNLLHAARVQLDVVDAAGRRIKTLLDERKQGGEYTVNWNTEMFGSGVYYYVLIVDGETTSRKLVLLN
ncbi:MAG: T9SS type A sorting domain-containing protein [Candidatus Eisenbacteria bacterium]|uniref:T9SS type A sorting domain-containing protein n=1 Tax=Eiseniibacteriota bacterium TaxID=2212470 RepID=A0A948RVM9_UNCEI|nr:T9SS type A sorting domain-containing protein [Candidatus Eisenbacteria bacterium]MBU1947087.1 T9SS type A sorting domain-containing protein [Candidatus Eisenbacteria bacterium]MBU2690811.1 T9SS type A sorting domain-containing protein [Candidatus Eisenbacteria bacterium]